jgi:hypothetical protein
MSTKKFVSTGLDHEWNRKPPRGGGGLLALGHVSSAPERAGHISTTSVLFLKSAAPPQKIDGYLTAFYYSSPKLIWAVDPGSPLNPAFDAIGHGAALMCLSRESRLGRFRIS